MTMQIPTSSEEQEWRANEERLTQEDKELIIQAGLKAMIPETIRGQSFDFGWVHRLSEAKDHGLSPIRFNGKYPYEKPIKIRHFHEHKDFWMDRFKRLAEDWGVTIEKFPMDENEKGK